MHHGRRFLQFAWGSRLGRGHGPSHHNLAAMDPLDVVVVGGCGHVGLPLALSLADSGYRVGIDDIDAAKIEQVKSGSVPFLETGAEELLRRLLPTGRLEFAANPSLLERTDTVILVIGTPIDEFMNPSVRIFDRVIDELIPHLRDGSLVVLRSTVYPSTTEYVERRLRAPGFAAGPCLLKDTMQLSAFTPDHFPMGQAAMQVNEGLPNYIVDTLNSRRPLSGRTVGILGMAFKGESDDPRASLSYKLRKLAAFKGARVLCTDPYIHDESFVPLDHVLKEAELLVIAAPHHAYKHLDLKGREVVDVWGVTGPIRL